MWYHSCASLSVEVDGCGGFSSAGASTSSREHSSSELCWVSTVFCEDWEERVEELVSSVSVEHISSCEEGSGSTSSCELQGSSCPGEGRTTGKPTLRESTSDMRTSGERASSVGGETNCRTRCHQECLLALVGPGYDDAARPLSPPSIWLRTACLKITKWQCRIR